MVGIQETLNACFSMGSKGNDEFPLKIDVREDSNGH